MAYSGKYLPTNCKKYKGNPTQIYYRSLWELKFMKWCDDNNNILEWGSEEIVVPYRSPIDGKYHRYFVDFYVKVKTRTGDIKKYLIEIKPKKQTIEPAVQKRKTAKYINEVTTYVVNQAKWEAAREWCADRRLEFLILTEDHLNVK
ncbi:head completion protein [bacterium]|nr:head completion protein [bacterium]